MSTETPTSKFDHGLCARCGAETPTDASECAACGASPLLHDRFRLIEIVGQGAAGVTYRALDQETGDTVAVKEMPLRHTQAESVGARMEREARVIRELSHGCIPAYVAHFVTGSGKHRAFYLVQAFIEGATLAQEMEAHRYTETEVLEIADEVLEILEHLHSLAPPVIHRDLKPGNLIRRRSDKRLVLIDFGAVRDVLKDPRLGGSTVAGTYGFMAPEQFRGIAEPRTDLYAVGVLMVVLLSRRDPLDLVGPDHLLSWTPHVHASQSVKSLISALLSPKVEDRPESAAETRSRLQLILNGEPEPSALVEKRSEALTQVPITPPTKRPPQIIDRNARRRLRARSKWMAVFLALVGCVFGIHNWYLGRIARAIGSVLFFWTTVPFWMSIYDVFALSFTSQEAFDETFNPALIELRRGDVGSLAEEIRALHQLKDDGVISQEEFDQLKSRLLGKREGLIKVLGSSGIDGLEKFAEVVDRIFDETPKRLKDELSRADRRGRKHD
ncbi:MAG: protein kinase domain-containing protein [Bradymonadia bacterium]